MVFECKSTMQKELSRQFLKKIINRKNIFYLITFQENSNSCDNSIEPAKRVNAIYSSFLKIDNK